MTLLMKQNDWKMKILPVTNALRMGYTADKRQRRRAHRQNARSLKQQFGPREVIAWHLFQARYLGR